MRRTNREFQRALTGKERKSTKRVSDENEYITCLLCFLERKAGTMIECGEIHDLSVGDAREMIHCARAKRPGNQPSNLNEGAKAEANGTS